MDRKEAIHRIAMLLGGTLVGAEFLASCTSRVNDGNDNLVGKEHLGILNEIADTILPTTDTPGAKAADVASFMLLMVQDCYAEKHQHAFFEGIGKINEESKQRHGTDFLRLDENQREELLIEIDKEQEEYMKRKKKDEPAHYFRMMKELTLLGYFTSEIGSKQALRYVPIPGRYEGEIPYKKGDRAWA